MERDTGLVPTGETRSVYGVRKGVLLQTWTSREVDAIIRVERERETNTLGVKPLSYEYYVYPSTLHRENH